MREPAWIGVARGYLGVREVKGRVNNPKIVSFFARIRASIFDDETPWCAAFVGSCLEECGIRSTRAAYALSYANYGTKLDFPAVGAIAYMRRFNSAGKVIGGHVIFVLGQRADGSIVGIGGNQADQVSIASFPVSRIMGYRCPPGYTLVRAPLPIYSKDGTPLSEKEA